MNLMKALYGVLGVCVLVLIYVVLEHISIRVFDDPKVLITYFSFVLGISFLIVLMGEIIDGWMRRDKNDD